MNRLANEKSPYLLQHADNPVDWYPWEEEAFEKAKKEDKPVFLSIGYATCHWCHVMEHESFEDQQVAEMMNRAFVNIKVDREERPDIDNTYMTVCQMLTGRGGWPLTIIMTPDKEPFFAGTYFPKFSRQRHIGMLDIVQQIENVWKTNRAKVMKSVQQIKEGFSKSLELGKSNIPFDEDNVEQAAESLKGSFDDVHGGFGNAPKFPSPHNLLFLIRNAADDESILDMVSKTLRSMRFGGIWDHVGGGFHRYSTDLEWLLPHFEKMLYDQATLLIAYAEGWKKTGDPIFKQTCYQILNYLETDLLSDEGVFYSAEDADSEGEEGKFYVWSKQEIEEILDKENAQLFCELFQITEEGNFRDEATGERTGKNIPHLSEQSYQRIQDEKLAEKTEALLEALRQERVKRERPLLDDKILTDWNGLMMAALAAAGTILKDQKFINHAKKIAVFLAEKCMTDEGRLLHRYKEGKAEITGMADDYAFTIWGFIELYHSTFDPQYLEKALKLQKVYDNHFWDPEHGGYYFTPDDGEEILGRQKEIYDGALPSSNSVSILNGFRLSRLTGDSGFEEKSDRILNAFSNVIEKSPAGYTFALITPLLKRQSPAEIVITCESKTDEAEEILNYLAQTDRLKNSIILKTDSIKSLLDELAPFTNNFPVKDQPAVYVCRDFSCDAPVTSLEEVKAIEGLMDY